MRVRRSAPPPSRGQLVVRVGPMRVICLDGRAVTDLAAAWAQAHASSADLLPARAAPPRQSIGAGGVAVPVAEIIAEGPQPWDVVPPRRGQPYALVTGQWLTVRVHDQAALLTFTRVWAQAADLGQHILRTRPIPFNRLLEAARDGEAVARSVHDHPDERMMER